MEFSKEEIQEIKNLLLSALDDGYETNEVTTKLLIKYYLVIH
jgi:hypothetical protein